MPKTLQYLKLSGQQILKMRIVKMVAFDHFDCDIEFLLFAGVLLSVFA
jgi:hypothetical protein